MDHECKICNQGTPKCENCGMETVKGEVKKLEKGIEIIGLNCPKCKDSRLDVKMPRRLFDENILGGNLLKIN